MIIKEQLNIMYAVLDIAHFTGWSRESILSLSADEIDIILQHIQKKEQEQWQKRLALMDCELMYTREYTKKEGKNVVADKQAAKKAYKNADKIRELLTGIKTEKKQNGGVGFGLKNGEKVIDIGVEEFQKRKAEMGL